MLRGNFDDEDDGEFTRRRCDGQKDDEDGDEYDDDDDDDDNTDDGDDNDDGDNDDDDDDDDENEHCFTHVVFGLPIHDLFHTTC